MVEPLSQQLYDLSVRAKQAEDAASAAQKEARDKIMARREQARADAHIIFNRRPNVSCWRRHGPIVRFD
jgi:hypothetical protein